VLTPRSGHENTEQVVVC